MINNNLKRNRGNIVSAGVQSTSLRQEKSELLFALVVDAELVMYPDPDPAVSNYVWRYKVTPAKMTWTGFGTIPTVVAKDTSFIPPALPQPNYDAFSISELSNTTGNYSYGVTAVQIPAGLAPVRIPDGTPVMCFAHKKIDGSFHYIIINTQAITGIC